MDHAVRDVVRQVALLAVDGFFPDHGFSVRSGFTSASGPAVTRHDRQAGGIGSPSRKRRSLTRRSKWRTRERLRVAGASEAAMRARASRNLASPLSSSAWSICARAVSVRPPHLLPRHSLADDPVVTPRQAANDARVKENDAEQRNSERRGALARACR